MLDCAWIQIVRRLVFVTCLFAVACVAGYFYYLWPASQHVVNTPRITDARNAIAGVLNVFISAQDNDSVNNPSPLGTSSASTSNHGVLLNASKPVKGIKYLSYQPPGNGWNNQRVALENAIVLTKLLNRTLLVHPMAPHDKGALYKVGAQPGYVAYNHLKQSDLVPLSVFLDLKLLSQLIPVQEVVTSHHQFYHDFGQLTWRNICHSMGFGYWMDRQPTAVEEIAMFKRQHFHGSNAWKKKCANEQRQAQDSTTGAIVEFVSDYFNDPSEMLYFEQGTLFGIHIRFVHRDDAIAAQKWILNHLHYGTYVHSVVDTMAKRLGAHFNAIHVRRTDHPARKFPVDYWIKSLQSANCSTDEPLYVATDEKHGSYFDPFKEQGYKLVFASDFHDLLQFHDVPYDAVEDVTGVYEQLLCEKADKFVPTPGSTFSVLILRNRNEIEVEDGLLMNSLHTFWIGHQMKEA